MNGLKFLADVNEDQLKNFPMTKGQKVVPKTKKEKKTAKRLKMQLGTVSEMRIAQYR
jgi:hypothetical protein